MSGLEDALRAEQANFEFTAGHAAKERGMAAAADSEPTKLEIARGIARRIATSGNGTADADAVGRAMQELGHQPGPWCGSIFKGPQWAFTGERLMSKRRSNHAREIKIWELTP